MYYSLAWAKIRKNKGHRVVAVIVIGSAQRLRNGEKGSGGHPRNDTREFLIHFYFTV